MIYYLKANFPNIYVIIISIAVVIWFYAVTGIIQKLTNNSKSMSVYLILVAISLSIMYFDDFSFSELYDLKAKKASAAAAVMRHHIG